MDGITDSMDMSLSKLREIVKDREGNLACCSPWSRRELDMTEQLNNNKVFDYINVLNMNMYIHTSK